MRRFRMRSRASALALGLVTAVGAASAVAVASAEDEESAAPDNAEYVESTDLITKEFPDGSINKPLTRLDGLKVGDHEPRLIAAKFTASMRFDEPTDDDDRLDMLMSTWVTCDLDEPTATQGYPTRSPMTSRNHEGEDKRNVTAMWMFTPPTEWADDATYSCVQWAVGNYTIGPDRTLLPAEGSDNTYLRVMNAHDPGAKEWYLENDAVVQQDRPSTDAREDVATIFDQNWTAASSASKVEFFHGVQATAGVEGIRGMDPLMLDVDVKITQLDADGNACAPAVSPTTDPIPIYQGSTHHLKVNGWTEAPVSKADGCTKKFNVTVTAKYILTLDDPPNKAGTLHGALADPLRPYSNLIAVNR
ncbi:MAG: hypothetical protein ACRDXX_03825 [Stackebrandtia sp.]